MNKNTYKIISIISFVIAIIGLISFIGGIKAVNLGVFIFPLLISAIFYYLYIRKKKE